MAPQTAIPLGSRMPEPFDFQSFRAGLKGKPFNRFIEHHIRRSSEKQLDMAVQGTLAMLPPIIYPAMSAAIDEWNETSRYSAFWASDSQETFDLMCQTVGTCFSLAGRPPSDEDLFNGFQVISLNIASMAAGQRAIRRFAGIRKGLFG
jgi:hypothetical protein